MSPRGLNMMLSLKGLMEEGLASWEGEARC
jgi:hypothetical protein